MTEPTIHDGPSGQIVWFTGLPSAGKSTLAHAVRTVVRHDVVVLDGDEVRSAIAPNLGFSEADRARQVSQTARLATMLARQGLLVLVPVIAPHANQRSAAAEHARTAGVPFHLVHLSTALDVCEMRDVKGLYRQARDGRITGMTGLDAPYDLPVDAALVVDAGSLPLDECVDAVLELVDAAREDATRTAAAIPPSP